MLLLILKIIVSVGHLNSPSLVCLKVLLYNVNIKTVLYFTFGGIRICIFHTPNQALYPYRSSSY